MRRGRVLGLVLAVALAVSASSLTNGFVFDDVHVIQHDPRIHSLDSLPALLSAPFWPRGYRNNAYRPATTVAFALDWAIGGGRPIAYHVTNVLLNLVVVALVLALAVRVLTPAGAAVPGPARDRPGGAKEASVAQAGLAGAVVAALWFAVQPVHVEAVANGVGLAELLAAAAYLGALLAYLADGEAAAAGNRARGRRAWLAVATLGAAAVGYGAKENAITLPAILLLADVWQARGRLRGAWVGFRRHGILWLGTVALALGYLAAREHALGPLFGGGAVASGLEGATLPERVLIMAPAVLVWARWFVWPLHLSADYLPNAFVPSARLAAPQLAGFAVLALVAVGAWRARRRMPGVTAGVVFLVVTASVAANVVVPTGVILAERLAYLPSVGVALVVGALWLHLPRGRWLWPATALALALLAARTLRRIPVWHDAGSFLAALERDAPDSYRTHWAMGQEAFDRGDRAKGEREMLEAIRIFPGDPAVLQELGERYLEAGLFLPASRFFLAAYRVDSMRTDAVLRGVFALIKAGRPDSAAAVGSAALRRFPDNAPILLITETAAMAAGRPRQALALARRLVFLEPASWGDLQLAGYAAARNGLCDEARRRLERAAELAPSARVPRELLSRLRRGPSCGLAAPVRRLRGSLER